MNSKLGELLEWSIVFTGTIIGGFVTTISFNDYAFGVSSLIGIGILIHLWRGVKNTAIQLNGYVLFSGGWILGFTFGAISSISLIARNLPTNISMGMLLFFLSAALYIALTNHRRTQ